MAEVVNGEKSEKDTTIQCIRYELRDEIISTRKEKRDAELNKSRSALGETTDNGALTEEYVTMLTKSLKKKPLIIQEYRNLQNALIQSENHINAFFKVDNAMHSLVRDLSGSSTKSKLAAANCCCNLALGDTKACLVISKFAGPYLIAELESTNQPLAEACAWTIGNLVYANNKALSILHAQGCMKSLITAAHQSSDTLLPAISYACLRYIHAGNGSIELEHIIKLGDIMAARYSKVADVDTMWLLAMLSSKSECHDHIIKCIPTISSYLFEAINKENETIAKISAAVRIICNFVPEPTGQVALYLFTGENEKNCIVVDKLLSHQYFHIRHETLWLIGNLYKHNLDSVQQIAKAMISTLPSVKLALSSFNKVP